MIERKINIVSDFIGYDECPSTVWNEIYPKFEYAKSLCFNNKNNVKIKIFK